MYSVDLIIPWDDHISTFCYAENVKKSRIIWYAKMSKIILLLILARISHLRKVYEVFHVWVYYKILDLPQNRISYANQKQLLDYFKGKLRGTSLHLWDSRDSENVFYFWTWAGHFKFSKYQFEGFPVLESKRLLGKLYLGSQEVEKKKKDGLTTGPKMAEIFQAFIILNTHLSLNLPIK